METDDIKSAVFVVVCMTAAGVFGYYAGKQNRVEVQRTVYVDTNLCIPRQTVIGLTFSTQLRIIPLHGRVTATPVG